MTYCIGRAGVEARVGGTAAFFSIVLLFTAPKIALLNRSFPCDKTARFRTSLGHLAAALRAADQHINQSFVLHASFSEKVVDKWSMEGR